MTYSSIVTFSFVFIHYVFLCRFVYFDLRSNPWITMLCNSFEQHLYQYNHCQAPSTKSRAQYRMKYPKKAIQCFDLYWHYWEEWRWNSTGKTVATGNGNSSILSPYSIFINDQYYIYIAEKDNSRIWKWPPNPDGLSSAAIFQTASGSTIGSIIPRKSSDTSSAVSAIYLDPNGTILLKIQFKVVYIIGLQTIQLSVNKDLEEMQIN
jgi:hypothetical protein